MKLVKVGENETSESEETNKSGENETSESGEDETSESGDNETSEIDEDKNSGSDNSDIHMHLSDQIKVCTLKCSQFSCSINIDEIVV